MKVFSSLISAQLENKASDYSPGCIGRVWFNTASSLAKCDDGSAVRQFVFKDSTDILTNKDIDGGTATNARRITLPKASLATLQALTRKEGTIVYASDVDKVYKDDGSVLTPVGTGGSGTKNYLQDQLGANVGNGNFELGVTTGWSLFNTTLTSLVPTGTITAGASSLATFATVASGQLAGVYSLSVGNTSGQITAGHGFLSDTFTIDIADQAKVLAFKFAYSVITGPTLLDLSGTSANTWQVYVYDVTNSAWIQPAGVYNLVQKTGVGVSTGTFQTTSNSTQYRLALICINQNSSGATKMYFDDFSVGPQVTAAGAAISDWVSYSAGTSLALTSSAYYWRRVGDSLEGSFRLYISGSASAVDAYIGIPSGLTIDTSKLPNGGVEDVLGSYHAYAQFTASSYRGGGSLTYITSTRIGFFVATGTTVAAPSLHLKSSEVSAGQEMYGYFRVPIVGWSSNTVSSADTDTRVIAAKYTTSVATTITTTGTALAFATKIFDTAGMWDGTTATIPTSGKYKVSAMLSGAAQAFVVDKVAIGLSVAVNGTVKSYLFITQGQSTATLSPKGVGTGIFDCNAGDTIQLKVNHGSGMSDYNLDSDVSLNWMSIERLSGPAVVQASESVVLKATRATVLSLNNVTDTDAVWPTVVFDSHGILNTSTGVVTIPVSGTYSYTAQAVFEGNGTGSRIIYALKNGSATDYIQIPASSSIATFVMITGEMKFNAGDTFKIQLRQNSGGTLSNCMGETSSNYLTMKRIGN